MYQYFNRTLGPDYQSKPRFKFRNKFWQQTVFGDGLLKIWRVEFEDDKMTGWFQL